MASLQEFLGEAQQMSKKKVYTASEGDEMKYALMGKKGKKKMAKMSSISLLADFAVPMWQRAMIEASEGVKTLKGVGKDLISKKAWTDPRKNKQWTEDLGKGFSEARNRVKSSLRKANDTNIEKELMKNKSLDLQVDKMRQAGKKKYSTGNLRDLAPLTRHEPDGLLAVNKSYNIGKKAKK